MDGDFDMESNWYMTKAFCFPSRIQCKCGQVAMVENPCPLQGAFESHVTFPNFENLSRLDDVDMGYYYMRTPNSAFPRRHWCFIAEVVENISFMRPMYMLRSRFGETGIKLAFYPDDDSFPLLGFCEGKLPLGSTIFILYGQRKEFMDFSEGIRQERLETCYSISAPFSQVQLEANNLLHNADALHEQQPRKCFGCGVKEGEKPASSSSSPNSEEKVKLKICSKCHMAAYCSRECQVAAWPTHKLICTHCDKLLRLACIGRHKFLPKHKHFDMISLPKWVPPTQKE